MRFSSTFLSELNSRVDLPEFIRQYVLDLKKESGDTYKACCPFHEEKSASFTVSQRKGFFHCFGCGAHGNAIGFLVAKHGKSYFRQAVEEVAAFAGVSLPQLEQPEKSQHDKEEAARFMRACAALENAQTIYSTLLTDDAVAQAYLTKRGVAQSSIEKYGLGFAPNEWQTITGQHIYKLETLIDAGLSVKSTGRSGKTYDRFRGRVVFPIYGNKDRVIGFGGRAIFDQDPKYLNSPECIVFKKGENLYGLKQAYDTICKERRVFVVEGYMDVVMVDQFGIHNVVASLGTSITDTQMKKVFRLCERVTFCMDGDAAGQKAAWRAAEHVLGLLEDKHQVDFMFMPDGLDPDDLVRTKGKEGFEALAAEASSLTEFVLDVFMQQTDLKNGESLAQFLSEANWMAEQVQSGVIKLAFQRRIAEVAGISLDTMLDMLKEQKTKRTPAKTEQAPAVGVAVAAVAHPETIHLHDISVAAKMLGISMLKDKSIVNRLERLEPEFLSKFLSSTDKEMLLPLLAYIKANQSATDESLLATLAFNPYSELIKTLALSASLVGEKFDAMAEAKSIIDSFRKMERVWQIVSSSKADIGAQG